MDIDWSKIGIVLVGIALTISVLWLLISIEEDKQRSLRKFKEEMTKAILHSQPTWQQMLDIAETSSITASAAYSSARELHKDILTGTDKELQPHRALLETYISSHKRTEPFEGLPNEIRIHLERLRESASGNDHLFEPLTTQIRELVSIHDKEFKAQKRYTSWGFFIGVLGAIFAGYAYFYPHESPPHSPPSAITAPK